MRFIVDTQLPPRLAVFLTKEGYDAIHTTYFPNGHLLRDKEIEEIAIQQDRIVVTKDIDFMDHYFVKGEPPKILFLKIGNSSNNELIIHLQKYLNQIVEKYIEGGGLVILEKGILITY